MTAGIQNTFLSLVRLGIGNGTVPSFEFRASASIDWNALENLAARQGLYAVVFDGVGKLPANLWPPQDVLLEWIGEVVQDYETRYDAYRRTLAEMVGFYNSHGIKMMVLKGYACGLNWPKPEHRPCGDIDIWQFGQFKEADAALEREKGVAIDRDHHHHTVYEWNGFIVENHYDLLNVHQHKSNVQLEKIIKELAKDDTLFVEVGGEKVYLPSANFHALFLLRHAMTHFAASGINFRQLLDWAFFVKEHGEEVDWKWLDDILGRFGMKPLFQIFNAICVEDLGFSSELFPTIQFLPAEKERVLSDILSPEFEEKEEKHLIGRYLLKYRRWKANKWKHDLCFNDSRWSAFWTGVWGHLIKPRSK